MNDALTACPKCGHSNSIAGARYCAKCGGSLSPEPVRAAEGQIALDGHAGPTREDVMRRLEEIREHPRYKEAMGMEIRGRDVLSHRVEGRRNGFFLVFFAIVGFVLYRNGVFSGSLERYGPGALFAVGAFGLFVLSRGGKRSHNLQGPGQSREAMVVAKQRNQPSAGPGRPAGLDDKFWVTLMDRQGVKEELSVKRSLFGQLEVEDSGAAYIKGRTLLRFEKIG